MAKGSGTTRSGSSGNPKGSKGEKPMSQAELDALDYYDSGDGMWVNNHLRGLADMGDLSQDEKDFIAGLDKATDRELNVSTLYRSVDAEAIFGKMSDLDYDRLVDNVVYGDKQKLVADSAQKVLSRMKDSFVDKGFISTTPHASVADDWGGFTGSDHPVVLKISVSKSARGVAVHSKVNDGVDEILLKRNQKVTCHRVYGKNGNIYVDVTI